MNTTQSYVQWSYPGSDETGFLLERSTDSGSTWPVQFSFPYTVTSYTDNDVMFNQTYWYRVVATNPIGIGIFSPTVNVYISRETWDQLLFISWDQSLSVPWNKYL
jgi:hypothetical protein